MYKVILKPLDIRCTFSTSNELQSFLHHIFVEYNISRKMFNDEFPPTYVYKGSEIVGIVKYSGRVWDVFDNQKQITLEENDLD